MIKEKGKNLGFSKDRILALELELATLHWLEDILAVTILVNDILFKCLTGASNIIFLKFY